MTEIWKDIILCEGKKPKNENYEQQEYEISNKGIVRNKKHHNIIKIETLKKSSTKYVKLCDQKYNIRDLMLELFKEIKYYVYYEKQNGLYRVYDTVTKKPRDMEYNEFYSGKECKFEMQNYRDETGHDFEANDEDLIKYATLLEKWNGEIKELKLYFNYLDCFSDCAAVTRYFMHYCGDKITEHEPATFIESQWHEKNANGGLQYLDKEYKGKSVECWSHDYKNQYGLCLSSDKYMIPTKAGKECFLEKLPKRKHMKPGFYRCHVICEDKNFKKIFMYSKYGVYLDIYLKFFMKLKKRFNIKFKLVKDDKPNAYLYEDEDMVVLNTITNEWYTKLSELKLKYPNNPLIKILISRAWGVMSQSNEIRKTYEQLENIDYTCLKSEASNYDYVITNTKIYDNDRDVYTLQNCKQPYKNAIRIKPWITAISKLLTAQMCLDGGIENVVRIQTDSASFIKNPNIDNSNIPIEKKTTGVIFWKNVNAYFNETTGYKTRGYDDKKKEDACE